jgi:hypothetical protein
MISPPVAGRPSLDRDVDAGGTRGTIHEHIIKHLLKKVNNERSMRVGPRIEPTHPFNTCLPIPMMIG